MINLQDITRRFQVGEEVVYGLRDVDLNLADGEYVSIMGPSGSGKSTLLNMLGLLDHPDTGSYRLDGVETTRLDEEGRARLRQQRIGFVFQAFHLVPRLTAAENIELPMILAGSEPERRHQRVTEVLRDLSLQDRATHRPHQLSGGQRQRVAIGRAVVMRPTLLLADEPTGNLDRHSGTGVIQVLEELNSQGITLLLVTHDPELGGRAGRTLHMVDGRIETDSDNAPAGRRDGA